MPDNTNNKKFIIQEKPDDFSSLANFQTNSKRKFTITKKIAKHGSQSIIVIPRILEEHLKPGTIAEISINIIEKYMEEKEWVHKLK